MIRLDQITPTDPKNGRLDLDPNQLQDLADDIAQHGLMNPVTVRRQGSRYDLIAGNRRLAAVRRLGWLEIPATLKDCTDKQAAVMRLHENTKRADLTPIEEAAQIQTYADAFDPTEQDLLDTFACTPAWLESRLELLNYPPELQRFVHAGSISLGAARLLARIPDPTIRDMHIRHAAAHGVSVSTARLWLQDSQAQTAPENELPNFTVKNGRELPQTTVLVSCFLCEQRIELQHAIRTHSCERCSRNLADAKRDQDHDGQITERIQTAQPTSPTQ
jgi:ParB family chromosome partitioning protein